VSLDPSFKAVFAEAKVSIIYLLLIIALSARTERGAHFWEPLFLFSTYEKNISREEIGAMWKTILRRTHAERDIESDRCTLGFLAMAEAWIRTEETILTPVDYPREGQAYYDLPRLWCRTEPRKLTSDFKRRLVRQYLLLCRPQTTWGQQLLLSLLSPSESGPAPPKRQRLDTQVMSGDWEIRLAYEAVLRTPAVAPPPECEQPDSPPPAALERSDSPSQMVVERADSPPPFALERGESSQPLPEWRDRSDQLADECMRDFLRMLDEPAGATEDTHIGAALRI